MCFIALEGNKDPNPIYDELQDAFQELYNDLENLGLKKKKSFKKQIISLLKELE